MITTGILGFLLGLSKEAIGTSALWMVFYTAVLSIYDIIFRINIFTGKPSPYTYYLERLTESSRGYKHPALSYMLISMSGSLLVGAIMFFLSRLIF